MSLVCQTTKIYVSEIVDRLESNCGQRLSSRESHIIL